MNRQSAKLTTLTHLEFRKKVIEILVGNVRKMTKEDQVEQL
jgi:hypothetical protein